MSQRNSGHARMERDRYETPAWVAAALLPHLPGFDTIWEPACGGGKMVTALRTAGWDVVGTDIEDGTDFLTSDLFPGCYHIITNPPYELATEFVEHAIRLTNPVGGLVAMLLRTDFDHASSRSHLFGRHPFFAKKIVLTRRIRWFEDSTGSPSFNHAWFIWNWRHAGPPTLAYGPEGE